jgi:heat shock protein HtpX
MMTPIECFFSCLYGSGLWLLVSILTVMTLVLFIAFGVNRGYKPLVGGQGALSVVIATSLFSMECYMMQWLWAYMGIVIGGTLLMVLARHRANKHFSKNAFAGSAILPDIEARFGVPIHIIDSQRVRAIAYRGRIYLSVGLLERLDRDEVMAVVAHELYHLDRSPSKLLSSLLALTSLTFFKYSDEYSADEYAADVVGADSLIRALDKLEIRDSEDRVDRLQAT